MVIKSYKILESTNLKAKELVKVGVEPWTVVMAEQQVAGYGRKGTAWFSPKGGLYFSIILPKGNIEDLQTLTILAAFVVAKTIKENFSLEPFIKLPNDVWINGKKVCGILTENVIGLSLTNFYQESDVTIFQRQNLLKKVLPQTSPSLVGDKSPTKNLVGYGDVKLSITGIGLNTNIEKFPAELKNTATSIKIESGKEVDNEQILNQIVEGLKEQFRTISE